MVVENQKNKTNIRPLTLIIRGSPNVRSDGPSSRACADIRGQSRMRGYP